MKKILIAIDGPAGSGKSTTAKLVARRLGYVYIDTGAMYRAMTLKVLSSGIDPSDEAAVVRLARGTQVSLPNGDELRVFLDGTDVTEAIRSEDVTLNASLVSSYPAVRQLMVEKQREIGSRKGCVMDGRDIGTVVFPDADLKFFMVADIEERARRRQEQLLATGVELSIEQVVKELNERDLKDSTREASPLKKAIDAIEIDTTKLTIEEQVETILSYANEIMAGTEGARSWSGQEEMQRK